MFSDKDYFGDPSWPQDNSSQRTGCLIKSSQLNMKLDLKYFSSGKQQQKESDQQQSSYEEQIHGNDVHMFLNDHKMEYSTLKYAQITYLDDFKKGSLFEIEESDKQAEEKIVSQECSEKFDESAAKFEDSHWVEDSNYQATPNDQNYLTLGEFFNINSSPLEVLHSTKPTNLIKSKNLDYKQNRQKPDNYFKQTQIIQTFLNQNHQMSVREKQKVMQQIDKRLQKKLIEPLQGYKDESEEYFQSEQLQGKVTKKQSAKYKILTKIQKQYLVFLATESTTTEVAKRFNISVNNICRWKKGCERKAGAGRRITNQQLEQKVIDFVKNQVNAGKMLTKKQVQMKAKEYSQNKNFKASKGWFERFMNRNINIFNGPILKHKLN